MHSSQDSKAAYMGSRPNQDEVWGHLGRTEFAAFPSD